MTNVSQQILEIRTRVIIDLNERIRTEPNPTVRKALRRAKRRIFGERN